ncbi:MAG: ABC transporter substrate-binding protein [Phycisphaerales bacterium]
MHLPSILPTGQSRAGLFLALACATAQMFIASCERKPAQTSAPALQTLVLYVSADDDLFRPIVKSFEEKTGAKVQVVGDTEATKTFGLVRRILDEKESPKADVFWASEPLGMISLDKDGLLEPLSITDPQGAKLPANWVPLAYRARVIVFHKERFPPGSEPRRLGDLLRPELKGKVGLARPQFGSTRTHFATLLAMYGEDKYLAFVRALKANEARLYDGNSMVVQAVAQGEISAGLTDSDDVQAGQAQKWKVSGRGGTGDLEASNEGEPAGIVLLLPHTAGVIANTKSPKLANEFVAYLLSEDVQKLFLSSGAAVQPSNAGALPRVAHPPEAMAKIGPEAVPDYREVQPLEPKAVELFERVWNEK